jgi:hypothetical protein
MKKIVVIITCIGFIGCVTVSNLKPAESELTIMQQKVPGLSLENAQKGFKLYKFNCAGCHYLHKPNDYTISGWEKILPEMLGKAKITSEKDAQPLKNYLFAKSK